MCKDGVNRDSVFVYNVVFFSILSNFPRRTFFFELTRPSMPRTLSKLLEGALVWGMLGSLLLYVRMDKRR